MEIIAHRGLHNQFHENSTAAIKAALENKIPAIEIDVRRCKTDEIVLFHDRNLKNKAGYNGYVVKTPYDILSKLKLKDSDPIQKIPTLKGVFTEFGDSFNYILDIKKETWIRDGLEENLIAMVNNFGLSKNVIFSSFNYFAAKRVARLAPGSQVGLILAHPLQFKLFNMDGFTSLHIDYKHLPKIDLNDIKKSGKKIYVWTLNDSEICSDLISRYPIDGIITDNPLEIKKVVNAG